MKTSYNDGAEVIGITIDRENPHQIIPTTKKDRRDVADRQKMGVPQFDAISRNGDDDLPGFPSGVQYAKPPINRFQQWIRRGMRDGDGEEKAIMGHYTKRYSAKVVEAYVRSSRASVSILCDTRII